MHNLTRSLLIQNSGNVISSNNQGSPSMATVSPAEASTMLSSLSAMGSTPTSSTEASTMSSMSEASVTVSQSHPRPLGPPQCKVTSHSMCGTTQNEPFQCIANST